MMYWNGWGWLWIGVPMMVLMAVAMMWMMRSGHGGSYPQTRPDEELDRRLAAGEITTEEYRTIREDLRRR